MKPKKFRDAAWLFFLFVEAFLASLTVPPLWYAVFLMRNFSYPILTWIKIALVLGAMLGGLIWAFFHDLWFLRAFGRLLVYEDRVVFKCPFRRTRTLTYEECAYIGVEDYDKLKRAMPVIRGDEVSFICFSKKPYPEEYKGKISLLKNTKDFIKIGYSDALAKELIDILPADKDYLLRSFYGKMQASDRNLGRNRKRKK